MSDPFFDFFYKDRPEADANLTEWNQISYKNYQRYRSISLPKPELPKDVFLETVFRKRKSERNFSETSIDKKTLGTLLFWSSGLINGEVSGSNAGFRRPYPSGGAKFPIEIYVAVFNGTDINKSVYHYNVKKHVLELISNASVENIRNALPHDFARKASVAILLSFIGERTTKKYGSLGYKLGIIEVGHIGQNIYLVGAALGLGVLALGRMDYKILQKELDLGEEETIIYHLVVGWPR